MERHSIKECLYCIKNHIDAVENGQREPAIFDEIESDFYEMLELIKLFMISERDSYYGYFMMNLSYHVDFCSNCIAGIRLNTYPPVMNSNPLLLCKHSLKEIIFIICHEIEHIVLNHPAEMVKANPANDPEIFACFNIAADASVNDRLRYEIERENKGFMTVPDGCILSKTIGKMFRLRNVKPLENYQYYYKLIKKKGISADSDNREGIPQDSSDGERNDSDSIITAQNCGKPDDHNWQAGDDADEITSVIREFINKSYEMMSDETRSLMPAYFLEQVKRINEPPKISWQKLLKKYVGTIAAGKRKTRTKLNRLIRTSRQLVQELGREPTAEEIAAKMEIPVERVREIRKISQDPVSLETPIGEEEDSHLGDFIQDDHVAVPAEEATFTLLHEQLMEALETLTEREQQVLRLRFGLDDGKPRTLEEVGKQFHVTRERIRQIEAKALRKLRHPSRSRKLKDYLD